MKLFTITVLVSCSGCLSSAYPIMPSLSLMAYANLLCKSHKIAQSEQNLVDLSESSQIQRSAPHYLIGTPRINAHGVMVAPLFMNMDQQSESQYQQQQFVPSSQSYPQVNRYQNGVMGVKFAANNHHHHPQKLTLIEIEDFGNKGSHMSGEKAHMYIPLDLDLVEDGKEANEKYVHKAQQQYHSIRHGPRRQHRLQSRPDLLVVPNDFSSSIEHSSEHQQQKHQPKQKDNASTYPRISRLHQMSKADRDSLLALYLLTRVAKERLLKKNQEEKQHEEDLQENQENQGADDDEEGEEEETDYASSTRSLGNVTGADNGTVADSARQD